MSSIIRSHKSLFAQIPISAYLPACLSVTRAGVVAAPGCVTECGEKEAELYAPRCESSGTSVRLLDAVSVQSLRLQLERYEIDFNYRTQTDRVESLRQN